MPSQDSCLVIYTRPNPLMPWRARTPLLTNRQVREILGDPGKVCELGESGTQLRVASFTTWRYDSEVHAMMSDREFVSRGVSVVSFMTLIYIREGRPPEHLLVSSGDGVIV